MKFTKKFFAALICAVTVLSTFAAGFTGIQANASFTGSFPLEWNGSAYYVTVLGRYSDGTYHECHVTGSGSTYSNDVMDIGAPANTKIYSVASGKVIENTYGTRGGYYVVIEHSDGSKSYYGHMKNASALTIGQSYNAGTVVGYVGKTGDASGYHLHFEWSGHDPYCTYAKAGYVKILSDSGASAYPHSHSDKNSYTFKASVSNITSSNASVSYRATRDNGTCLGDVTYVGMYLYTDKNCSKRVAKIDEKVSFSNKYNYCYGTYTINGDLNYTLKASTTYYYKIYIKDSTGTYKSGRYSFKTQAAAVKNTYTFTANTSKVTKKNAVIDFRMTRDNGTGLGDVTYVGMYVYTDKKCTKRVAKMDEKVSFSNNYNYCYGTYSINSDMGYELKSGTTYYYKLYIKDSTGTITSGVYSFKTK